MSRRIMAGLTGVALAGLLASSAFAYQGTIEAVNVTAPSTAVSGEEFDLEALVLAAEADLVAAQAPVAGEPVAWDFDPASANVTLGAAETTTDADGIATNTATIVCNGCTIVFTATVEDDAGGATGSATVVVKAKGLPDTSTSTGLSTGFLATLLAIVAVIAGAGLMARQVVVTRR